MANYTVKIIVREEDGYPIWEHSPAEWWVNTVQQATIKDLFIACEGIQHAMASWQHEVDSLAAEKAGQPEWAEELTKSEGAE